MLAVLSTEAGRAEHAVALLRQVIAVNPRCAEAYSDLGSVLRNIGRIDEAVASCREAVRLKPDYAEARNNLSVVLKERGLIDEAIAEAREAVRLKPTYPEAHDNLGNALHANGLFAEAVNAHREAVRLHPSYGRAYNNFGVSLLEAKRIEESVAACRVAVELDPMYADGHSNLGSALYASGHLDEAIDAYRIALRLRPDHAEASNNLGAALRDQGRLEEAIAAYRHALRLKPDSAEVRNNLGAALRMTGRFAKAVAALKEALRLKPGFADAWNNLGLALKESARNDDAITAFESALRCRPDFAEALTNLGVVLCDEGNIDEGIAAHRRALAINPALSEAHTNLAHALAASARHNEALDSYDRAIALAPSDPAIGSDRLYTLHCCPDYDAAALFAEHQEWSRRYPAPMVFDSHANDPVPDRRLRIGYVSPDFWSHVLGLNLLPILRAHHKSEVEVFCYAANLRVDEVTEQFRSRSADVWRSVGALSDDKLAEMIRADGIDILVDLALHAAGNRLPLFARKPAPIEVTYLAYCSTSGLDVMDYRLSDSFIDPPGVEVDCYSEETVRLPRSYWQYRPSGATPEVSRAPLLGNGYVTFGCLNNFIKISQPALELWMKLLGAVPQSHLLLHAPKGSCRKGILEMAAQERLSPDRLEFVSRELWPRYIKTLQRIDAAARSVSLLEEASRRAMRFGWGCRW